ncbi:MAG: MFS transporter, partial [Planctomycetes bacterium]|nr:MFS transporter [Planctomycetota bacterium]
MNKAIRTRLSVMMFLEYVIWGSWLPLLTDYLTSVLKFTGLQAGWIQNTFAIASLVGMFLGGQLADRYLAQEKFLALSHLVGGISMLLLPMQTAFWPFFLIMLVHCLFYVPTLSVTNAIAFANLRDSQRDFGYVRVWGTIGWIVASWPFIFILGEAAGGAAKTAEELEGLRRAFSSLFTVAGGASVVLAGFCFLLPHTPPAKGEGQEFAPLEALKLLA